MNATAKRTGILTACLVAGVITVSWHTVTRAVASDDGVAPATHSDKPGPKVLSTWDQKAAAAYLDQRANWWMEWPKSARDHETFCISCHTAVPYALSRPSLRKSLAESAPSANERRLLDNVTKRVRLWKEVEPFYKDADRGAYKSVESRGTESVLNALILASNDAQNGQLTSDTLTAFDNMWAEQQTTGERKGEWLWLRFANEPWEADDSDFYGATLAAIAVGTAPENYRARLEIAKLPGLLDPEKQKAITAELLSKQQPDGGWSLSALSGTWKRHDNTPQEPASDGYATGLITLALQQSGTPRDNPQLKQGIAWLTANQSKTDGNWPSSSLNNNAAHHIAPTTVLFMNDAATAYAVLSLSEANRH